MKEQGAYRNFWLLGLATVFVTLAAAPVASASVEKEEQQGARVLSELNAGSLRCSEAGASEFEHVGEYVMGRMMGSPEAHESMNSLMARMMGSANEEQVHEVMGRRFAGCGNPAFPARFGETMGAMGMMTGGFGPGSGAMMGGDSGSGYMMGGSGSSNDHDNLSAAWILLAALGLIIGATATALIVRSRLPRAAVANPRDALDLRLAHGEISADEYRRQRKLLEDSP